jgi:DNA-binding transcriptional MocR family regulator
VFNRQDGKSLPRTNTLAYYKKSVIYTQNFSIILGPGLKLAFSVMTKYLSICSYEALSLINSWVVNRNLGLISLNKI